MPQEVIQIAYVVYWCKEKCFVLDHTWANKAYPDQTAPKELSEKGMHLLQRSKNVTPGYNELNI